MLDKALELEVYLKILLYCLLEDSGRYVSCNLSDFHLSWKRCFYLEVIVSDQLHQCLSRPVDHGVGDDSGLAECRSQCEAWEDVPAGQNIT